MIRYAKEADERREAGGMQCCCLHGSVGLASDWRPFAKQLATEGISTRAVDLWRFLQAGPMSLSEFATTFNHEAREETTRGNGRALLGYSLGGRLALHALLENPHPWNAAIVISANPGLEDAENRASRRAADRDWATRALTGNWPDFLTAWNAQLTLGAEINRDPAAGVTLAAHRQEIARSFLDWSVGVQESLWDRLAEINIPVLWIVGAEDLKYREIAERAVTKAPRFTLQVAPDVGHRVPWEATSWMAKTVSQFLKSIQH